MVGQQNIPNQSEADTLTVALGTEKGRKQLLADFRTQTEAVVFDGDGGWLGRGTDPHIAIVPHGFEGIFSDIEQGLLQLLSIEGQDERGRGQFQVPLDAALLALGL